MMKVIIVYEDDEREEIYDAVKVFIEPQEEEAVDANYS